MLTRLVIIIVMLALVSMAHGYGRDGHLIVGELAFRQLQPDQQSMVKSLLSNWGSDALARSCDWPDLIKFEKSYTWSQPLHYVNVPLGEREYDASRDCQDNQCILAAITENVAKLRDRSLTREKRAEALKFVCHFVGDLHQPLHTGFAEDRGGNHFKVSLSGEQTNLHSIWDHKLVAKLGSWPEAVDRVEKGCPFNTPKARADDKFIDWFLESRSYVMDKLYPQSPDLNEDYFTNQLSVTTELDEDYITLHLPESTRRLCRAGKRLGWLLNSLFAIPISRDRNTAMTACTYPSCLTGP